MKKHIRSLVCLFVLLSAVSCNQGRRSVSSCDASSDTSAVVHRLGFNPDTLDVLNGTVHRNQFFSDLMTGLGMSLSDSYDISAVSDSVFDVRRLKAGNQWQAYYSINEYSDSVAGNHGKLSYFVYSLDRVTDVVFKCTRPYSVWLSYRPISVERLYADVTITTSLWNDMLDDGVSPLLILELSDIYAWTVDFFGLQEGDRFRVLYDMKMCDGEPFAVDTVRYAVFSHQGHDYPAIMFNQGDGGNVYWNEKGESMRKAFLKAPLRYSRISSGFSYSRRHPITRKVQAHTGVDYAAPAGTPVVTIGDGVITSMRNEGAGGNVVRIRHNSVYSTAYLHLSRFAKGMKVGRRVAQGDVIGYVGSTGRSTGPHLDFRVWKNGSPINPLKMQSPPAEPLKEENRAAFDSLYIFLSQTDWSGIVGGQTADAVSE